MASIDCHAIVKLAPAHTEGALALSAEAGWNQTADDWRMMIARGHATGIEDECGKLIASALALPYDSDVAWISMVLVTADWQRKGIAKRLVAERLGHLMQDNYTAFLDATPAGAEVYRRLGFETVRRMTRWQRRLPETGARRQTFTIAPAQLSDIVALDRRAMGANRRFILEDMHKRDGAIALSAPGGRGFVLSRRGRLATQIGPVTAEAPRIAMDLLDAMLVRAPAPVFIDAFDDQEEFSSRLAQNGFVVQRTFERMVKGPRREAGDRSLSFAAAGPELG